MSVIIRFEDPPPPARGCTKGPRPPRPTARDIAAALRENPQRWALVREGGRERGAYDAARSTATVITRGRIAAFQPTGDFEAVTRTVAGQVRVYARYLPGGEG